MAVNRFESDPYLMHLLDFSINPAEDCQLKAVVNNELENGAIKIGVTGERARARDKSGEVKSHMLMAISPLDLVVVYPGTKLVGNSIDSFGEERFLGYRNGVKVFGSWISVRRYGANQTPNRICWVWPP